MVHRLSHLFTTAKNMALRPGLPLNDILKRLQSFAPLALAESWDNVGLLVDPLSEVHVHTVMLTNDLTEDVVNEAVQAQTGLIVSYHPNIFKPMKSVAGKHWKERIIIECIKHNIAVYSPHTSWDAAANGVNDWLGKVLPFKSCVPLKPNLENPACGVGRLVTLQSPVALGTFADKVKIHIGIPHVRVAIGRQKDMSCLVSTVAICAGSGSSVLADVEADLYLTGEMLHHDILEATQRGIHVLLCNHSDSERGFLKEFQPYLQSEMQDQVRVLVSAQDKDPLVTV